MTLSPYSFTPFTETFVPPEQIASGPSRSAWWVLIAFAVLEDALECVSKPIPEPGKSGRKRGARIKREAREWFESEDRNHVGTFLRICEALNLDPDYIRRGVLRDGFRLQSGMVLRADKLGRKAGILTDRPYDGRRRAR